MASIGSLNSIHLLFSNNLAAVGYSYNDATKVGTVTATVYVEYTGGIDDLPDSTFGWLSGTDTTPLLNELKEQVNGWDIQFVTEVKFNLLEQNREISPRCKREPDDPKLCTAAPTKAPNGGDGNGCTGTECDDNGLFGGLFECFSADDTVQVQHRGEVAMKDIAVGDAILVGTGTYEPVYMFGHRDPFKQSEFVQIYTTAVKSSRPLEMSPEHMVFLANQRDPIPAGAVKEGDLLRTVGSAVAVTKVKRTVKQGLYTPLTQDGSIVVNGVIASQYTSFQTNNNDESGAMIKLGGRVFTGISQHGGMHMALAPVRWMCLGVSQNLCQSYGDDARHSLAGFGLAANEWTQSQDIVVQAVIVFLVFVCTAPFLFVEVMVGANWAPLLAFALGLGVFASKRKGRMFGEKVRLP